jgi:hypothetical protein
MVSLLGQVVGLPMRKRQRRAGGVRQARALDDALGGLLHGRHGVMGIGLNGAHQRADLLGGFSRAFGQPLHLFRHHREAPPCLACGSRLDRGVQRQHVGLFGNVGNQLGDLANLL